MHILGRKTFAVMHILFFYSISKKPQNSTSIAVHFLRECSHHGMFEI